MDDIDALLPQVGIWAKGPYRDYVRNALRFIHSEQHAVQQAALWLPKTIVDAHVHCNDPRDVSELPLRIRRHMISTFPGWPIDLSHYVQRMLYPDRHLVAVRFPNPYPGVDHRAANDYLLAHASGDDRVAAFGLQEDVEYTRQIIRDVNVVALKMYYLYADPPAVTIAETFPGEILKECQNLGKPIILHLPRPLWQCTNELISLVEAFPRLKVILAHLGMPRGAGEELQSAYDRLAEHANVLADTAMISSRTAIVCALSRLGPGRVLFGSDEPLNLVRAVVYRHPTMGERLATEFPYHWADPREMRTQLHRARGAAHLHWAALTALRAALHDFCGLESAVVRQVFAENAVRVFGLSSRPTA